MQKNFWKICLLMIISSLFMIISACDNDDGPCSDYDYSGDPRTWSHDALICNSTIEAPTDTNDMRIVYLHGKPFQMGYQHGYLLKEELLEVRDTAEHDLLWGAAFSLASSLSPTGDGVTYIDHATNNSLDWVIEECEGMVAGSQHAISMDICITYNSITYILEDLLPRYAGDLAASLECSGVVAANNATTDGDLIHARNLDWLAIDFIMDYPIIFVKKPSGGVPYVNLAFPGFVAGLTGMNQAGIAMGMDENSCKNEDYREMQGIPPMQQITDTLSKARSLEDVENLLASNDQASCQMFIVSDGVNKIGSVFEMTAVQINQRKFGEYAPDDVIWATNHFEHPDSQVLQSNRDIEDLTDNSVSRYYRLSERLTGQSLDPHPDLDADAPDYSYGEIDVPTLIDIMRDPVDLRPDSERKMFPCTEYEDGNWAVGNNHNVHSAIMKGGTGEFWLAAGWDDECDNPIYNPYVGFSIQDLLADNQYTSGLVPTYDPEYNDSYGNGTHTETE